MVFLALFIVEVVVIFFLSRFLSSGLSSLLMKITKSKEITINILSFIFLPGVIIHELSHLLIASILFVRVGEIEFLPKIIDGRLKLGSVRIAKTDPLRHFVIGFAPLIVGLFVFFGIFYFLMNSNIEFLTIPLVRIFLFYFLFTIVNTMFSSRKDMEGALVLGVAVVVLLVLLYFVGVRFSFSPLQFFLDKNLDFIKQADLFLLGGVLVDALLVVLMKTIDKKS